jgi:hypothetical protein
MGKIAEIKYKILERAFRGNEDALILFDKIYPPVKNFVWTVAVFMAGIYIFFKILDRIGFHKTVIILMVSIAVYMRSWLKVVLEKQS